MWSVLQMIESVRRACSNEVPCDQKNLRSPYLTLSLTRHGAGHLSNKGPLWVHLLQCYQRTVRCVQHLPHCPTSQLLQQAPLPPPLSQALHIFSPTRAREAFQRKALQNWAPCTKLLREKQLESTSYAPATHTHTHEHEHTHEHTHKNTRTHCKGRQHLIWCGHVGDFMSLTRTLCHLQYGTSRQK